MKNIIPLICFIVIGGASCSTSKKTTTETTAASHKTQANLNGTWELDIIPYNNGTLDQLYPEHKPTITFNEADANYIANTSCNTAKGKLVKDGSKINFSGEMMMTRMACPGDGEKIFIDNLRKINTYVVSPDGQSLTFIQGDIALMRFHKSTP